MQGKVNTATCYKEFEIVIYMKVYILFSNSTTDSHSYWTAVVLPPFLEKLYF
jgi:hypothetical protein